MGGSYVVVQEGGTEKLVFKEWLKDLNSDTREEVIRIFDQAIREGWVPDKLNNELSDVEELTKEKRASTATFTETRVQEHQARMAIWARGEVRLVQRHATGVNSCKTCLGMDGEVYEIWDAPPLSHPRCMCYYTIYSF